MAPGLRVDRLVALGVGIIRRPVNIGWNGHPTVGSMLAHRASRGSEAHEEEPSTSLGPPPQRVGHRLRTPPSP